MTLIHYFNSNQKGIIYIEEKRFSSQLQLLDIDWNKN